MRARFTLTIVTCMLVALVAAARENGDNVDSILLPMAFVAQEQIPGAHGSVWTGEVWMHINSKQPVNIEGYRGCAVVYPCYVYPAGYTGKLDFGPSTPKPEFGILLSPPVGSGKLLTFSNRIYEITRRGQPRGIDIPVVRESEFFDQPVVFLGIPTDSGVRASVRVYDPRVQGVTYQGVPRAFLVEALELDGYLLGSRVLTTAQPIDDASTPGYDAIADLLSAFPAVASHERVNVRVTPQVPGTEFWAMVALTDNDTQTVSIITAQ